MDCPNCGRSGPEISTIVGDRTVTMGSCRACDRTYWQRDGEVVDLREVLDRARTQHATSRRS